jgi:hypothetical protein
MSVEGLSGLLLLIGELGELEELGFCAFAGTAHTQNRSEAARHKENSAGCCGNDLAGKDTIGIRRSHKV